MFKTVVCLVSFAVTPMLVPFSSQTVVGAATTTAHVGATVKVGLMVDQADNGVTELFTAVPYNPSLLTYAGLEPGSSGTLTATSVSISATQASLNMTWKGSLPAGQSLHLGYARFSVKKADSSEYQAVGVNTTAKDSTGTLLKDVQVLPSTAVVQLVPRPLRVQMDLLVQ